MSAFINGFLLQASLIFALGAQNLFVLDAGLRRNHHLGVALVCTLCDNFLVLIGVLGVALVFTQIPLLKIGVAGLGVLFLGVYGLRKLMSGCMQQAVPSAKYPLVPASRKSMLLTALGFSLLNPHVYLDTVILIGGYSSQYVSLWDRVRFGLGAGGFSGLWFFSLALLAASFHRLLNNSLAMRSVSLISGVILLALACKLGWDVVAWIQALG